MTRRLAVVVVGVLLTVAGAWAAPPPAYACSCVYENDDPVHADHAEVIFTGTVVGEGSLGYNRTYTFAVEKVYKGSAYATQRVRTASQSSACGLELDGSGPFLVLAGYAPNGEVLANSCGGTTDAPAPAGLGPGSLPRPGAEPPNASGVIWPAVGGLLVLTAAVLFLARRRRDLHRPDRRRPE